MAATLVAEVRRCGSGEVMKGFLKVLWAFLRVLWILVMGVLAFLTVLFGALAKDGGDQPITDAPRLRVFD
jgi:hypothetical protein